MVLRPDRRLPTVHARRNDGAERGRRADPPESHAGDLDDPRGARRLDARAMGKGQGAATARVR